MMPDIEMPVEVAKGFFVPSVSFSNPGDLTVSYTRRLGRWSRVDDTFKLQLDLLFTPTYTNASGNLIINVPAFTIGSISPTPGEPQSISPGMSLSISQILNVNYEPGQLQLTARVDDQKDTISLQFARSALPSQNATVANFPSGTAKGFIIGGDCFLPWLS